MRPICGLILGLLALSPAVRADQAQDRAAILDLMQRTFDAIASGDPDRWRPLLTDEARNLSFSTGGDGGGTVWRMRERAYKDRLAQMDGKPTGYLERWIGEPTILVQGPIAVAWGEYEFWIEGVFSHCGVDTVNLAKIDGQWKIAHFMWTADPNGCPEGHPKARTP